MNPQFMFLLKMVVSAGIEPATSLLSGVCSNRLSYETMAQTEGVEPTLTVLETVALPLNYVCRKWSG